MSKLSAPHYHDEAAAFERLEQIVWPNGPVCPHCGGFERITPVGGKTARMGLKRCGQCRKQFTVKVGTVFESSHVPLHKWFQAAYLLASSKKGISSYQLHRTLEVTYKTAWFMTHRLREAMAVMHSAAMGGEGKIVEADETYFGEKDEVRPSTKKYTKGGKSGPGNKRAVIALVERGGKVRSFPPERADLKTVKEVLDRNVSRASRLMTDESRLYMKVGTEFVSHEKVRHSGKEYVRGDVHTNTIEGFFSIFKRGMTGIYQHCGERHLKRYLAEFDFRYNERHVTDVERAAKVLEGIKGKRLTYQTIDR